MRRWLASVETAVANNWPSYDGLLEWMLFVSLPSMTYEMLADSGDFGTPDQKLASALILLIEHSKQADLQAKIDRIL